MKRMICKAAAAWTAVFWMLTLPVQASAEGEAEAALPRGWLLWHSYSSYSALDSRLYLRSPDGTVEEIRGSFLHAMNGSFGTAPDKITFMAIDPASDEWDIYLFDGETVRNLTPDSGFRNEDPKWSPDGGQIVFKRGRWAGAVNDFVYNLALLDVGSKAVTMLTDDSTEEAMPCFSADGTSIYYADYADGIGAVRRLRTDTGRTETVFAESGVTAYYPVVRGRYLYFTKWYSAENRCDQIMRWDGAECLRLPFNSEQYDCSDACPVSDTALIYSASKDGSYDLYFDDGARSVRLSGLSTPQNDLGAQFFAAAAGDVNADGVCSIADAVLLRAWLLAEPDTDLRDWQAADLDANGRLNAADFSLMKQKLLGA